MTHLINIGFGNIINSDKIVSIITPDSAPAKRMIQNAREAGNVVDATQGRRTRAIIVTDSNYLVLSALLPDTIVSRYNLKNNESKEEFVKEENVKADFSNEEFTEED